MVSSNSRGYTKETHFCPLEKVTMGNRIEFLNDLELEDRLKDMSDREIIEFVARQTYDVCNLAGSNERRIVLLEKRGNKFIGGVGVIGAFIGAIVIAVINYFAGR